MPDLSIVFSGKKYKYYMIYILLTKRHIYYIIYYILMLYEKLDLTYSNGGNMRISTKGRYALAAVVSMAQQHGSGEYITAVSISERLGISKIYLEQVFSLLKRGGLVVSIKGAQGGYLLSRSPDKISAFDVLSAVEGSLFEKTEDTVADKAPEIETAMRKRVFDDLDVSLREVLSKVTLEDLKTEAEMHFSNSSAMFYI